MKAIFKVEAQTLSNLFVAYYPTMKAAREAVTELYGNIAKYGDRARDLTANVWECTATGKHG